MEGITDIIFRDVVMGHAVAHQGTQKRQEQQEQDFHHIFPNRGET